MLRDSDTAASVCRHLKDDRYPLQFPRSTLVFLLLPILTESRRSYLYFRVLHLLYIFIRNFFRYSKIALWRSLLLKGNSPRYWKTVALFFCFCTKSFCINFYVIVRFLYEKKTYFNVQELVIRYVS